MLVNLQNAVETKFAKSILITDMSEIRKETGDASLEVELRKFVSVDDNIKELKAEIAKLQAMHRCSKGKA